MKTDLDRKTKMPDQGSIILGKLKQSGEVPGSGGIVLCHTIKNDMLYSLWNSGDITVVEIKSGRTWTVNLKGWNDVKLFLWTCEQAIPKLGSNLQRDIASYISAEGACPYSGGILTNT